MHSPPPSAISRIIPAIWEVILTGGDPLTLSDAAARGDHGQAQSHRSCENSPPSYTRAGRRSGEDHGGAYWCFAVPPARRFMWPCMPIIRANCPGAARAACARFIDAGIPMLSQSVLLAGVNDDIETLSALMRAFVEARIKPYYLHHLDPAPGTAHFRVPIAKGRDLMRQLRGRCVRPLPAALHAGYSRRPRQVTDWPKLSLRRVPRASPIVIADYKGQPHIYPPEARETGEMRGGAGLPRTRLRENRPRLLQILAQLNRSSCILPRGTCHPGDALLKTLPA